MSGSRRMLMSGVGGNGVVGVPLFHFPLDGDFRCLLDGEELTESDMTTDGGGTFTTQDGVSCVFFQNSQRYCRLGNRAANAFSEVCGGNPRTISCWFNRGGEAIVGENHSFVSWGSKSSMQYMSLECNNPFTNLILTSWAYRYDIEEEHFTQLAVPPSGWCHAVGVTESDRDCTAYLNGVPVGWGTFLTPRNTSNTGVICIGTRLNDTNHRFNGYLADLRIYARALTETEIARLYAGGIGA